MGPMESIKKSDLLFFFVLFVLAISSRLIPHPWNFTAVGAVAVVSGFLIENKILKLVLPISILILSDAIIGFHITIPFVYFGFAVMTLVPTLFQNQKLNYRFVVAPMIGSFLFYLISNFGVWLLEPGLYPKTISGLVDCYVMAVPFYKTQFLADVLLTPIIYFALRQASVLVRAKN